MRLTPGRLPYGYDLARTPLPDAGISDEIPEAALWRQNGSRKLTMDKGKSGQGGKPGMGGGKQDAGGKSAGTPPPGMKVGGGADAKPIGQPGKK